MLRDTGLATLHGRSGAEDASAAEMVNSDHVEVKAIAST